MTTSILPQDEEVHTVYLSYGTLRVIFLQLYSTNSLPFVYIYGFIQSNLELRECEKKCEQNRPSHFLIHQRPVLPIV